MLTDSGNGIPGCQITLTHSRNCKVPWYVSRFSCEGTEKKKSTPESEVPVQQTIGPKSCRLLQNLFCHCLTGEQIPERSFCRILQEPTLPPSLVKDRDKPNVVLFRGQIPVVPAQKAVTAEVVAACNRAYATGAYRSEPTAPSVKVSHNKLPNSMVRYRLSARNSHDVFFVSGIWTVDPAFSLSRSRRGADQLNSAQI